MRVRTGIPDDLDLVLKELPKWCLLAGALEEIEEEMMRQESSGSFRPYTARRRPQARNPLSPPPFTLCAHPPHTLDFITPSSSSFLGIYLLTYDPTRIPRPPRSNTVIASNSKSTTISGRPARHYHTPWLLRGAANVIFQSRQTAMLFAC